METDNFYSFWKQWFAQTDAAKMERSRVSGKGGFYPLGLESPGYTGRPDPKEYYHWRLKEWDAEQFGSSQTRAIFLDCYEQATRWLFNQGLDSIVDSCRAEDCVLRILHYLPTPTGLAGEAHRDFDLLTVNVGGTAPGLEVYTGYELGEGLPCPTSGEENHCECPGEASAMERCPSVWRQQEGGVHAGEMLEVYAAGRRAGILDASPEILATPHRVRIPPNTERYAAVFFYLPPMDFELRPNFTAKDYLLAEPGSRTDGWVGVLKRAGTADQVKVSR